MVTNTVTKQRKAKKINIKIKTNYILDIPFKNK